MNRRKKGNQILKARAKKANAKLAPKNKTKYVTKAERAQLAEQQRCPKGALLPYMGSEPVPDSEAELEEMRHDDEPGFCATKAR